MANKVNLRELFLDLQDELEASLGLSRRHITHPTVKGDASELKWVKTLRNYLPLRYQVARAVVVDSEGTVSDQIDIVIFDRQYCPFLMNHNGTLYIPAESVYAVFEVKPEFSRDDIRYAGSKAESVRSLKRTNAPIPHAAGLVSAPKEPLRILAGILALDTSWADPFGDPFVEAVTELTDGQKLDLGCCVRHGSFELDATAPAGAASIQLAQKDMSLVFFILRLLHRLQALGTVPAMELDAYLRQIDGESKPF